MKWNLDVPKILHIYWSNDPLYYLRYATITSFMKYNPDWKVILWMPKVPYKVVTWTTRENNYELNVKTDYYPDLLELPIKKKFVDMEDFGLTNKMSEVHKSDYLRYWILHEYGGVWADMDILFFKSIKHLKVNIPENKKKDTYICISPKYGHSAGFYMSVRGSMYFKIMQEKLQIKPEVYQSVGPHSVNAMFPTLKDVNKVCEAQELGMDAVYMHDGQHIPEIFNGATPRFNEYSIGCHWYGGHPDAGKFLRETDGGRINLPNNLIANLLRNEI